jgi:hypothetical protein
MQRVVVNTMATQRMDVGTLERHQKQDKVDAIGYRSALTFSLFVPPPEYKYFRIL